MKIIILAAGIGSRLGNPFPKPLTTLINGKSIIQSQIENLTKYFSQEDIFVVVGFKKDLIMEKFPNLGYIYNPYFDCTNTSKSLLKAIKKFENDSILWLNGDVVFEEKLLSSLIPYIKENKSFISVNKSKVGEEEVKYTLKDNFIHKLSKEVEVGLGEAVGINFINNFSIKKLSTRLEECDDNDYFEKGIENAISKDNLKIEAVDISKFQCTEIDFKEDLELVNKMLE